MYSGPFPGIGQANFSFLYTISAWHYLPIYLPHFLLVLLSDSLWWPVFSHSAADMTEPFQLWVFSFSVREGTLIFLQVVKFLTLSLFLFLFCILMRNLISITWSWLVCILLKIKWLLLLYNTKYITLLLAQHFFLLLTYCLCWYFMCQMWTHTRIHTYIHICLWIELVPYTAVQFLKIVVLTFVVNKYSMY